MINTLIRLILGFAVIYFVYQEAGAWTAVVCFALFLFILALAWQASKQDEQLKAQQTVIEDMAQLIELAASGIRGAETAASIAGRAFRDRMK